MGNAVISGILFQPPSPPNELSSLGGGPAHDGNNKDIAHNKNSGSSSSSRQQQALAKKRAYNMSVDYLWLYSLDEYGESSLIPAIHIKHNDAAAAASNTNEGLTKSASKFNATHPMMLQLHNHHHQQQQQQQHQQAAMMNPSKRYTLLYSHGNAEDLGLISSFLVDLARLLQINVLCYDYSGYGVSTSEEHVAEFYNAFGTEVKYWKQNVVVGNNATNCEETASSWGEVTAANGQKCQYSNEVFVAPMIHPTIKAEGDDFRERVEFALDESMAQQQKLDDEAFDFTNTCSCIDSASTAHSTPIGGTQGKLRSRYLSHHSWTMPSPSEMNCYANIRAAYTYLTTVEQIPPKHVILYGKSVGSGPTCWLAQTLCNADDSDNNGVVDMSGCAAVGVAASATGGCGTTNDVADESREPEEARVPREGNDRLDDGTAEDNTKNMNAPGGVVLHSPFLSVIRVVLDVGFTTIGDLFPNVDRVGDFT